MAAIDMNYVDFYNPNLAPKPSYRRPAKSVMNKHKPLLQAIESQPATLLHNAQAAIRQPNKVGSTERNCRSQSKGRGTLGGDQANQHDDSAGFADNDLSDDSLPSFDELFRRPKNRDIPQVSPQIREPLHGSKHQPFEEDCLPTNLTISKGNTQEEPLIIDDESEDEAETEVALGDLCSSIEDQDGSVYGLTTQDTASTHSSLFGPPTPQGSEDLDADYFSKEEPRLPFAEQRNSTSPVQVHRPSPNCSDLAQTKDQDQIHPGIARSIIDDLRSSHCDPLHEMASGSCDLGSVSSFEDEIRQALEEPEESRPSSASHSPQCNQMSQENQRCTVARGISEKPCFSALEDQTKSEERLQEYTTEQQPCSQQEQGGEDEDDVEAARGKNKGTNRHHQQIKESLQYQEVGDKTIDTAPISQDRHSVESCHVDDEDEDEIEPTRCENKGTNRYQRGKKESLQYQEVGDETIDAACISQDRHSVESCHVDIEDEDARPASRRKRRRISSHVTESLARKKGLMPSAVAQAQTCTTQGSTASRSSSSDAESIRGADYQEWPFQGFLKRMRIGRDTTYNLEFSLPDLPDLLRSSIGLQISNPASVRESVQSSVSPRLCASYANNAATHSRMRPAASQREIKRALWTPKEDAKLRKMQRDGYSWDDIHAALPGRSKGAIQVRYSTKLKT